MIYGDFCFAAWLHRDVHLVAALPKCYTKNVPTVTQKLDVVGGEGNLYAVEQGDQLSLEYLTKEGHKVDKKLIDEIMIEIGLEHIEYDEQEE